MAKIKSVCRWGQLEHIEEYDISQDEFDEYMAMDEDERGDQIFTDCTQDAINNSGFEAYTVLLADGEEEE